MHPGPVPAGDRQDLVHRVDRAQAGGAGGRDHGADPAPGEQRVECPGVHPPRAVGRHRGALDAEHAAHPGVGVVRLLAVGDAEAGMGFPGHVEGFQVGDRAAGGQVAEVGVQAEHRGQRGDGLLLHLAGRGAAVQRVVVRVDEHRGEVPGHGGGVRRLEHLPGVARVEERVVVPQPPGELGEDAGEPLVADEHRRVGRIRPEPVLPLLHRRHGAGQPALQVHPETVPPAAGAPRMAVPRTARPDLLPGWVRPRGCVRLRLQVPCHERHGQDRGLCRGAGGRGRNTTFPVPEHGTVMLVGMFFGTKKLVKLARTEVAAAGASAAVIFFPALPVNPSRRSRWAAPSSLRSSGRRQDGRCWRARGRSP